MLFAGAAAPWAPACAAAVRAAFAAHESRPVRVACSTCRAADAGGLFSGRAELAEHVVMKRGLFIDHFDALGRDSFLGADEGAAFFYLAQGLVRRKTGDEEEEEEEELDDLQAHVPAWPLPPGALPAAPPAPGRVSVQLWMSPRATTSNLHFDGDDNLLCVLRGRKRVALVGPRDAESLRPAPAGNHCEADVWGTLDGGGGVTFVDVCENDVLAIPRGHWHSVRSVEGTIALNFWC